MLILKITFPWGRYYAHPWGINPTRLREAEWPPSPWRLLRALVSAWFRAHPGMVPSDDCIKLIETLGHELPLIGTGKVSFGQTVHWQPNYGATGEGKPEVVRQRRDNAEYKNTRHENHFVAAPGPVFFRWMEASLSPVQESLLKALLAELSYFGRAESLCHAELCESKPTEADIGWCKPTDGRKISSTCRDVFCPKPGMAEGGKWHFEFTDLWSRRADGFAPDCAEAPPHLVDRLLSTDVKTDGAEWRSYQMPEDWPQKWVVRTPRTARATSKPPPSVGPKVAHYLCFSLQCRVPLLPKFIVPLSEQFRDAANSQLCRVHGDGTPSFALFGHAKDRPENVVGDHQHAFYLPMANQDDPHCFLSDLHVWCPYGFTQAEVEVLLRIQRLNWGSGKYPVRPVLTALSKEPPADAPFATEKTPPARLWRSASPFVPPRYFFRRERGKLTTKEKDQPERQLAECLKALGIKTPGVIRRLTQDVPGYETGWDIVRAPAADDPIFADTTIISVHSNGTSRMRSCARARRVGMFFEIAFDEPPALPVPALGHSCHFGLGLFVPVTS
jgi:CRISPR-associated protein Csb2